MTTPTYTPLANITLGTAASSIVFASIPSTFRDLVVVFAGQGSTDIQARLRLNGITTAIYNSQRLSASFGSTTAQGLTGQTLSTLSEIAKARTTSALQLNINIMDYSTTDRHKTIINRAINAFTGSELVINRWANTGAVNSVTILTSTGNWAAGTTAAIYGIVG